MISVIIPVYNSANKGLKDCLQRVSDQTYDDLQVLLVDDGSTDESGRICDEWVKKDSRFEVIHQQNQGPAIARNVALKHAKGDEIAFVDSDDLPDVNLLQILYKAMISHQADMSMAQFCGEAVPRINLTKDCLTREDLLTGLFDYYTPLYKNLFAKLYRSELLENLCFESYRTAEDLEFLSRVYSRVNQCACIDQSLYIYNMYDDSVMHSQTARDYMDILQCYERIVERFSLEDESIYGRALDALLRKIVSIRYRNRSIKDLGLSNRLNDLERKYLSSFCRCENGNLLIKIGLLICMKLPWLHAMVMNYRER